VGPRRRSTSSHSGRHTASTANVRRAPALASHFEDPPSYLPKKKALARRRRFGHTDHRPRRARSRPRPCDLRRRPATPAPAYNDVHLYLADPILNPARLGSPRSYDRSLPPAIVIAGHPASRRPVMTGPRSVRRRGNTFAIRPACAGQPPRAPRPVTVSFALIPTASTPMHSGCRP